MFSGNKSSDGNGLFMKNQLVVHMVFENFLNDSRIEKTALSLQKYGFNNKVIAIWRTDLKQKENIKNIEIYRIKLPLYYKRGKICVTIGLLYFSFVSIILLFKLRPHIIHCHNLESSFSVLLLKIIKKKTRYIYNSHELHYGTKLAMKRSRITNKTLSYFERLFSLKANNVIQTTEERAQNFEMRYGVKADVISNFPSVYYLPNSLTKYEQTVWDTACPPRNAKRLIYVGAIAPGRGLELVYDLISKDHSLFLVILGDGDWWAKEFLRKAEKLDNFYLHKKVEPDKVPQVIQNSHCGICLIEDICISYRLSMPTKLFEYIYAGIPILGSGLPLIKKTIENDGEPLGEVLKNLELESVHKSLRKLLTTNYPIARFEDASKKYSWESMESRLIEMHRN